MRQDRLQPYGATVAPSPTTSTIRHTIAYDMTCTYGKYLTCIQKLMIEYPVEFGTI